MWPFSSETPELAVENNISTQDAAGYTIDAMFIIAIIIIVWRWRRNARRLRELESATTKLRTANLNNSV